MSGSGVAQGVPVTPSELAAPRNPHKRWTVRRHDCIEDGAGYAQPCEPPCEDPWQVDAPFGRESGTYVTWAEAFAWADKESRRT